MKLLYLKRTIFFGIITLLTLLVGTVTANADPYFEGFESCSGNEDNLYSLPEGWDCIGSMRDFALSKRYYKSSSPSLTYTSGGNTSDYLVTPKVRGQVVLWYYGTNSRTKGTISIYECQEEDGTLTVGHAIETDVASPCQTWTRLVLNLSTATRLAILMSRTAIDDFIAVELVEDDPDNPDPGTDPDPVPQFDTIRALEVTAFARTIDYAVTADEQNEVTVKFLATVQNRSNVKLEAREIGVSLLDADDNVLATVYATDTLGVDSLLSLPIEATLSAGEGGGMSFYVKETVTGTYATDQWGRRIGQYFYVTSYLPQFDIDDAEGYRLMEGETITFGMTNQPVGKEVTIKNGGTAPLIVNDVALPDGFSASETSFSVEAGTQKTIKLTLDPQQGDYGTKVGEAVITHSLGTFSFAVSGTTANPDLFLENFESKAFPAAWTVGSRWNISSRSGNNYAQCNRYDGQNDSLITARLQVLEGETFSFQAMRAYASDAATLLVYVSEDGRNWSLAGDYGIHITSSFETFTIEGLTAGDCYLKFVGNKVGIDNLYGFHKPGTVNAIAALRSDSNQVYQLYNLLGQRAGEAAKGLNNKYKIIKKAGEAGKALKIK